MCSIETEYVLTAVSANQNIGNRNGKTEVCVQPRQRYGLTTVFAKF